MWPKLYGSIEPDIAPNCNDIVRSFRRSKFVTSFVKTCRWISMKFAKPICIRKEEEVNNLNVSDTGSLWEQWIFHEFLTVITHTHTHAHPLSCPWGKMIPECHIIIIIIIIIIISLLHRSEFYCSTRWWKYSRGSNRNSNSQKTTAKIPRLSFLQDGCYTCRPTNNRRLLNANFSLFCQDIAKKVINSLRRKFLSDIDIYGRNCEVWDRIPM